MIGIKCTRKICERSLDSTSQIIDDEFVVDILSAHWSESTVKTSVPNHSDANL